MNDLITSVTLVINANGGEEINLFQGKDITLEIDECETLYVQNYLNSDGKKMEAAFAKGVWRYFACVYSSAEGEE